MKRKETEQLILTADKPKRTRNVIKWEDDFDAFTCTMMDMLYTQFSKVWNRDGKPINAVQIMRKFQLLLRAICQMVKTGKMGSISDLRDDLSLALQVSDIDDAEIIERLNVLINKFNG